MEVEPQRYEPIIRPITFQFFVAPLFGKTTDQNIIDQNLEKLRKFLEVYEEKLRCTKYLAGDYYTLADLHHLPCTHYFVKTSYASLVNSHPRVRAWWEDILSRPAFMKVAENMVSAKN
ncbi:hypothetical protein RND81_10G131600 [Saponaria officinalis]|uniref:glutathione transferase n=1 Tax=Saponaria officinalis TaxID=3572 RepID=A0AAW1I1X0_SAPOF